MLETLLQTHLCFLLHLLFVELTFPPEIYELGRADTLQQWSFQSLDDSLFISFLLFCNFLPERRPSFLLLYSMMQYIEQTEKGVKNFAQIITVPPHASFRSLRRPETKQRMVGTPNGDAPFHRASSFYFSISMFESLFVYPVPIRRSVSITTSWGKGGPYCAIP